MTTYTRVQSDFKFCRCCLSRGCFKDFSLPYYWMGEKEIYEEMLYNVFNLTIPSQDSNPENIRLICELCITRLRDASNFKKQVIDSKKNFTDFLNAGRLEVKSEDPFNILKDEIKSETEDFLQDCNDDSIDDDVKLKNESLLKTKRLQTKKKKIVKEKEDERVGKKNKGLSEGKFTLDTDTTVTKSRMRERELKQNTIKLLKNSNICPFRWQRNMYKCFCCKEIFPKIMTLRDHTEKTHSLEQIKSKIAKQNITLNHKVDLSFLICKICATPSENLKKLTHHLNSTHSIKFENNGDLLIPFRLENDSFQCQICMENFQVFHKLNVHMNCHYQNYICDTCGSGFASLLSLREHMQRHVKIYKCDKCDLNFTTLYQKDQHNMGVHKQAARRACPHCPERFKGHYNRLLHLINVHGITKPEYKCGSCDRVFLRQFLLNSHVRKFHMKERRHECEVCGIKFFGKFDLTQHMTSHTGERNHRCSVCGKSYTRKGTLRNHLKLHNNVLS